MRAKRNCQICGANNVTSLHNIQMKLIDNIKLPETYYVVCCNKCGFCYADTSATKEEYDQYYMNNNVYSDKPKSANSDTSKFNYFKDIIKLYLSKDSILLNIGIGDGEFELQAVKNGYKNTVGIDPCPNSVKKLISNGIKAYEGSIYDSSYKNKIESKIDAVFLFDVLEHLLDLNEAFNNLINVINHNTKVFITVPNCGDIEKNITPIPNNFNQEHINYFSKYSLGNLLSKYGFKEIYCNATVEEIYSLYVYDSNSIENNILNDKYTIKSMKKYFYMQDKLIEDKRVIISQLVATQEPIIVWGIGAYTMYLFEVTQLAKCNIKYFIDNNSLKESHKFNGFEIKSPNKVILNADDTILILSMLYADDIEKQIRTINDKIKIIK